VDQLSGAPVADSGDDVARLVALTERQHDLWALLRAAQDEETRNRLFDELSANRADLAQLKEKISAEVRSPRAPLPSDQREPPPEPPRSVGEELRARILTPDEVAPAAPPPPPPPPPLVVGTSAIEEAPAPTEAAQVGPAEPSPVAAAEVVAPPPVAAAEVAAPSPVAAAEVAAPSPAATGGVAAPSPVAAAEVAAPPPVAAAEVAAPSPAATGEVAAPPSSEPEGRLPFAGLAPEKTPFSSREADLAATRPRRDGAGQPQSQPEAPAMMQPPTSSEARPAAPPAAPPTVPATPQSKRSAGEEQRLEAAHAALQDLERMRPKHSRSFPVFAILIAIMAVAAVVWMLFFSN
jgi:hypothetical protein